MDIDNMTAEEFKELLYRAFRMELEDSVDINHACLAIHTSVSDLLTLLKFPEMRPLQNNLEELRKMSHPHNIVGGIKC